MEPLHEVYGSGNYKSGRIRIAFSPGNEQMNKILHGGIILGPNNAARDYGDKTIEDMNGYWSENFHTFVLDWQPRK